MRTVNRKASGFTLVEILIVVVILGILAAIVIPQFTSASESAQASNVASQLQTIRSQIQLYEVEHGGNLPELDGNWDQMTGITTRDGTVDENEGQFGPYLQRAPRNPFAPGDDDDTVDNNWDGDAGSNPGNEAWDFDTGSGRVRAVVDASDGDDAWEALISAGLRPGEDFVDGSGSSGD